MQVNCLGQNKLFCIFKENAPCQTTVHLMILGVISSIGILLIGLGSTSTIPLSFVYLGAIVTVSPSLFFIYYYRQRLRIKWTFHEAITQDILINIFSFLTLKESLPCRLVSRKFNACFSHELFWKNVWPKTFPYDPLPLNGKIKDIFKRLYLWSHNQKLNPKTLSAPAHVTSLITTEHLIIAGSKNGEITWWNKDTLEKIAKMKVHTGEVLQVKEGNSIFSFSNDDKIIKVWDLERNELPAIAFREGIRKLAASQNWLVGLSAKTYIIYNRNDHSQVSIQHHFKDNLECIIVDERTIVIFKEGCGKGLLLIDIQSKASKILNLHYSTNPHVFGKFLIVGSYQKNITIVNAENTDNTTIIPIESLPQEITLRGANLIALVDSNVFIWDISSFKASSKNQAAKLIFQKKVKYIFGVMEINFIGNRLCISDIMTPQLATLNIHHPKTIQFSPNCPSLRLSSIDESGYIYVPMKKESGRYYKPKEEIHVIKI